MPPECPDWVIDRLLDSAAYYAAAALEGEPSRVFEFTAEQIYYEAKFLTTGLPSWTEWFGWLKDGLAQRVAA